MRVASSGLLVPAMGLAEGTGDTTATQGVEWAGSGEAAVFLTGVMHVGGEDVTMAGTTGDPNVQQRNYRCQNSTYLLLNHNNVQYTAVIFTPLYTINIVIPMT